ncbi:MAG: hypothetical protein DBX49_01210 [Clostridia bacterium]|nr:MAG: hypothetical protein DBX49_01210 [Clostridia bacterium]
MRDYYGAYQEERYSSLYAPMRGVMSAMGKAMWHFAQLKEMTWYQWGYAGITGFIHHMEHVYPEYIDQFKGLMAQLGLPIAYPPIEEFRETEAELGQIFRMSIRLVDEVNMALSRFIEAADSSDYEPLARQAETIQMANFAPRAILTQALAMSEQGNSAASLDAWLKGTLDAPQQA